MGVLADQIKKLGSPAILIGNGINQTAERFMTWDELLKSVSGEESLDSEGLTYPELYNFIQLKSGISELKLKKKVCNHFTYTGYGSNAVYGAFLDVVKEGDCPVLTTNFDLSLKFQGKLDRFRLKRKGFTRYYPWDTYFSTGQLTEAWEGFGIWHVHGFTTYPDSVRMGLSDYMGSVGKAREQIQSELSAQHPEVLPSLRNWLDIWFRKPLIIIGLSLEEQEVFIRWLLIERMRYYSKFELKHPPIVLLLKNGNDGNHPFLRNLEVEIVLAEKYLDLYC